MNIFYLMYPITAIKMAVCLVDIIDNDVSQIIASVTALQPKLSQVAICLSIF